MKQDEYNVSPWLYVITLYLPFGIFMGFMQQFPQSLLKLLGYPNTMVGALSISGIVLALRFIYAPWLDGCTTKRRLSLITISAAAAIMLIYAAFIILKVPGMPFFWVILALMMLTALTCASHETAADGYYIRALNPTLQAQFIGIKTSGVRVGAMTFPMLLLWLATRIAAEHGAIGVESPDKTGFYIGFAVAYAAAVPLLLLFVVWNKFMIPPIPQDQPVKHSRFALGEVLRDYARQERSSLIVLTIILYISGNSFLNSMRNPFLLDPREVGGLGATAGALPLYTVLTDAPWMIMGGILGGYIIKWYGLRRTFIPLALFMGLPNLGYAWVAWVQPEGTVLLFGQPLNVSVLFVSSFESFGYGLSFSACFYYIHIMATFSGRNKTSILATSLSIMTLSSTLFSTSSGFLQSQVGYFGIFLLSGTLGLLVLFIIPLLPMPDFQQNEQQ